MVFKKYILIINLIFLILASPSQAMDENPRFEHLTIDDGLSENSVICILQDSRGFMWFGTGDGLNRYDGYDFKFFKNNLDDSTSIGSNYILFIFEDSQQRLWIGTWGGGLNLYDWNGENFIRYLKDETNSNCLNDNSALSIYEDHDGTLWIGTLSGGLNRFHPETGQFKAYPHDPKNLNSPSHNVITTLFRDQYSESNDLWIGTGGGGLNRLDPETGIFTHYRHEPTNPNSIGHDQVTAILPDPVLPYLLWIGTRGGGICRYNLKTDNWSNIIHNPSDPKSLSNNLIYTLFFDESQTLWAGTFGGGLNRLNPDNQSFLHFQHNPEDPASISDDKVISLHQDNSGVLWIGTHKVGVNKLTQYSNLFSHYRRNPAESPTLSDNFITTIYEGQDHRTWIGTQNGMNIFDSDMNLKSTFHNDPDQPYSLSHNWISSMCEDQQGNLWVATYGGGLNLFQDKSQTFIRYTHDPEDPSSISDDRVLSIIDFNGYLWLGIRGGGLNRFDYQTEKFTHYLPDPDNPNSINDNIVRQVYADRSGILWLATNTGLNRFDPKTQEFQHFQFDPVNPNSISDNRIFCIMEDHSGFLWVGTIRGLNKFDRRDKIFERYLAKDGFPSEVIYGILEDKRGYLWMSTNRGLIKFHPQTLDISYFDINDGLQANEFNVGAYYQNKEGEFFFGGYNGLNSFYPDSIIVNTNIPSIVLSDFQLFNQSVTIGKNSSLHKSITETADIQLSHQDKVFSFEFAALDYVAPAKNQYAYQMVGFDDNWVYSGNRRFVTYTNLDPGQYTFRVKGTNNSGTWNETGRSLDIYIAPPFWMTWWFRILLLLTISAILYAIYKFRVNSLLQVERTRTRIARDLHDDLSATLSSITFFGEAIKNKGSSRMQEDSQKFLSSIISGSQSAQEKIKDIIWAITPENDSMKQLISRFQRYASDLFESRGMEYQFEIKGELSEKPMNMERRQHLWLILKEIITNAVKHSQAKLVRIEIAVAGKLIRFDISDDGSGFDPNQKFGGNGLKNLWNRADQLKAKLSLNTAPDKGTHWQLEVEI